MHLRFSILLLGTLLLALSAPAAERRVALVIGNNDYASQPLKNALNDARDMAKTLRSSGFEVDLLENADLADMARAVRSFAKKLGPNTVALFFYSGHGFQVEGFNYLIPMDFEASDEMDAKRRALAVDEVLERMERSGSSLNMLILDACRDNPFRSGRSGANGLAAMTGGRGTLIAFATAPGKVALDVANVKSSDSPPVEITYETSAQDYIASRSLRKFDLNTHGVFTGHLLNVMLTPGLGIEEVFRKTRQLVDHATNGKQTPFLVSGVVGEFYFVPPDGSAPTPTPAPELAKLESTPKPQKIERPAKEEAPQAEDDDSPVNAKPGKRPNLAGKYPEGSQRYLTQEDLVDKTVEELRIMRNEIYARNGYIFPTAEWRNYFKKQPWYKPENRSVDSLLSDIESTNAEIIENYEQIAERQGNLANVFASVGNLRDDPPAEEEPEPTTNPSNPLAGIFAAVGTLREDSVPVQKKQPVSAQNIPGRYPQGSLRKLMPQEISGLDAENLRLLRNEIYARHGLIFKTQKLRSYFEDQPWYEGTLNNVDDLLTPVERANIELIKKYEK